jgi:hypothetical protein
MAGMTQLLERPVCRYCGVVIGAYEPMMLSAPGEPIRRTSWLAEEQLSSEHRVWHETCFLELPQERDA